jgi:transposase
MGKMDCSDDEDGYTYEGLPATVAMGMAMMESTGIRKLIDETCADGVQRKLTIGMGIKAIVGTMFEATRKSPLYLVNETYNTCPTDKVFGRDVVSSSLSDTSLGKCLDSVFKTDMQTLLWECTEMMCDSYDLNSNVMSMDATNYSLYGMGYDRIEDVEKGAEPAYGGNSKTKRNDLVQKNVHAVTNGMGVLRTTKAFSGNVSDMTMNNDTIGFLVGKVDPEKVIVSADCKLANSITIDRLLELGWGFVTKAPSNFNDLVKSRIVNSASSGMMDESEKNKGRFLYDTEAGYGEGKLRFVAYRLPGSIEKSMEYLTAGGFEQASKRILNFKSRKFFCEDDARKEFGDMTKEYCGAYSADVEFFEDKRLVRKDPDGPHWRCRATNVTVNESGIEDAAERFSIQVLTTNLRFAAKDSEDLRKGTTADTAVDLYLGQYHTEKNFRIMKSGMGVNHVYLHARGRQDALVFAVSLATAMTNVIDSVMQRNGDERRAHRLIYRFKTGMIHYDRESDKMRFRGPPGRREEFYGLLDVLNIDRGFLLGF